ncbi:hypothetical protein E2566_20905 [Pectobacterium punjabense]|uniref:Uncharacterized protein n=1 Tax=Pectobacterium punjabense TaxID=2108399 RepID=A0ABX6L7J1_9GAMM|nr:hypothetical protein [Pectobacterium punjabense]MBS4429714.1 hypothetical protein [Pectobacterium punjabense]PTA64149.1 hypothetical protein C9I36_10595 [Pectobacterium punjabense]QJA22194.1 hypothetical protein E2566_20905 [Pectobacterium punjabense]CNI62977.1 Uncharacterised protein [Yersinia frederiksenii]
MVDLRKEIEEKQDFLNSVYQNAYYGYQSDKSVQKLDYLDEKARELLRYVDTIASDYNTDDGENLVDYQYVVETCFDTLHFIKRHFTYMKNEIGKNTTISNTAYSDLMRLACKINDKGKKNEIKNFINEFNGLGIPTYGLRRMTIKNQRKLTFSILTVIATFIIFIMALSGNDNLIFMYGLVFNALYIILIMMFSSREKILLLSLVFYVTLPVTIYSLPFDSTMSFDFGVINGSFIGAIGVFILLIYKNPMIQIFDFLNKSK